MFSNLFAVNSSHSSYATIATCQNKKVHIPVGRKFCCHHVYSKIHGFTIMKRDHWFVYCTSSVMSTV